MVYDFIRGDTYIIQFETDEILRKEEIKSLTLTARKHPYSDILFQKNINDFSIDEKTISVEIKPQDTQKLNVSNFGFDIELVLNDGTTSSLIGKVNLVSDYTYKDGDFNE